MKIQICTLKIIREDAESKFESVLINIEPIYHSLNIIVLILRVSKRQIHWENTPSGCTKEY